MRRSGVLIACLALLAAACSSSTPERAGNATTTATIRVVNQNLLHGTACPEDTNRCDLPGRVALFIRQLERADCPEIVAIEEANPTTVRELTRAQSDCDYDIVSDDDPGQDREVVLTTLTVLESEQHRLAGPLRTAYRVRMASDAGPIDLIASHLASGSDDRPCDAATCSPPCRTADTVNTCQGRQVAALTEQARTPHSIAVLAGDLNAQPDEPTISAITAAGLVDTHLMVGNAECDPATGDHCTSGRADDSLIDMTNSDSKQSERIDYIFLAPIRRCTVIRPTGVFAPRGGPTTAGNPLVFPADHSAVIATIRCRTSAADLAAAKPLRTTTTTRATEGVLSPAVEQAVTEAFTTLFAPNPDADAQLATLENAAALRDSFIARKQAVGALADQTSVRIDSFQAGGSDATVDLTFSILLNDAVVLDALPGQAKLVNGHWLVTTKTYCQVATLGIDTIPEACQR